MGKIFHYTNYDGKIAIEKSGFLKMSKAKVGDALYGDGVYFTAMGPLEATEHLIMNNWGIYPDNPKINHNDDYVIAAVVANTEWYFEFDSSLLPSAQQHIYCQKFPELGSIFFRDIWVYPDRDLPIGNLKAQRRDTKGFGINVENGVIRYLTKAEELVSDSRLKKPRPFIEKMSNISLVTVFSVKPTDDEDDGDCSPSSSPQNRTNRHTGTQHAAVSRKSQAQDGMKPATGLKKSKHRTSKASTDSTTKSDIQNKTCPVFHSVQVAEKLDKEKNSIKIWKRFREIFQKKINASNKTEDDLGKKKQNLQLDEIDGHDDDEYDDEEPQEADENLCFLCFINAFCV